jgi:hypothetical protein
MSNKKSRRKIEKLKHRVVQAKIIMHKVSSTGVLRATRLASQQLAAKIPKNKLHKRSMRVTVMVSEVQSKKKLS